MPTPLSHHPDCAYKHSTLSRHVCRLRDGAKVLFDNARPKNVNIVPISPRADVLDEASRLITGDRNNQYGPPTQDFARTAALWTVQFGDLLKDWAKFEAHHVALAQMHLKMSRLAWTPKKRDSWVDAAGYAGCGYECATEGDDDEDAVGPTAPPD